MASPQGSNKNANVTIDEPVMPIAIIGMAGRYPGEASTPEKLWELIVNAKSAMSEIPKDRFNIDAYYHPNGERTGSLNLRGAHFMNRDKEAFDAPFFSITPNEAKCMDPQQRMALECTYEAMENAGVRMEDLVGSDTSVYVGSFTKDYSEMMTADQEDLPLYFPIGTGTAILSNRLSWFFDLQGPSISIDTACSSALVALHLGCQSLRTGEAGVSIVGGTNFILLPGMMTAMASLGFLSPDSICHSFDEKGNGYARGEGASFVVLKPLDKALADGDVIRGVIRNTGCNQDGNTPGITVPSADSQEAMIRKCYAQAKLPLDQTQYVEAHGTGTQAGDPQETSALSKTLGKARPMGDPLLIGSIKTNIGHLEGASGLAQVTKAIFSLEKGELAPNLWFDKANARIPMDDWNLKVVTKHMQWPTAGPRRISINSFGYGGTNAHCILDDAYHYLKERKLIGNHKTRAIEAGSPDSVDSGVDVTDTLVGASASLAASSARVFSWSSNEQAGVERVGKVYQQYVTDKIATGIDDKEQAKLFEELARTLASRRSIHPWRTYTVASSLTELVDGFANPIVKAKRAPKGQKLGFIFTGQGAQWYKMGRELLSYGLFQQSLEDASAYLTSIGCEWDLLEEFTKDEQSSRINSPAFSQPICTALQIATLDLLKTWNIKPSAVAGHSSGEIGAAYAKGALSREDSWAVSYHRGRLSEQLPELAPGVQGTMLATGLGAEGVQPFINELKAGKAVVACKNSPTSTTVSGDYAAVVELESALTKAGHFARRLKVETAYHSHHMKVIADLYLESLKDIKTLAGDDTVKMFSSVTGKIAKSSDLGASYWVSNMVGQVDFLGAVQSLCRHSDSKRRTNKPYCDILLELGPSGALQGPVKQILKAEGGKIADVQSLAVLDRKMDACTSSLNAVGRLHQLGIQVNMTAANNDFAPIGKNGFCVDIAPFPWNHENKYWAETQVCRNHRFRDHVRSDLLGARITMGNSIEPLYRNVLKVNEIPWMECHKVQGTTLYPAAGMMVMAIQAAVMHADPGRQVEGYQLRDVIIGKAILVQTDDVGTETMLSMRPWREGTQDLAASWDEFRIFSRQGESWELNCSGMVRPKYRTERNPIFANEEEASNASYMKQFKAVEAACTKSVPVETWFDSTTRIGFQYAGPFKAISSVKRGNFKSRCDLIIPDTKAMMPKNFEFPHVIHPGTLDSIVQFGLASATPIDEELNVGLVPTFIEDFYVSADLPTDAGLVLHGTAAVENEGQENSRANFIVYDDKYAKPLVTINGFCSTALRHGELGFAQAASMRKLVANFHWQQDIEKLDQAHLASVCLEGAKDDQPETVLASYMDMLAHKNPVMKILEIGAGSGSATLQILKTLGGENGTSPRLSTYTYTDINQEHFDGTSEKFKSWLPWMSFHKLDITEDPTTQGFKAAEFDLIVAHDVIGSVTDVVGALGQLKKCLKTDGKILFSEKSDHRLITIGQTLLSAEYSGIDVAVPAKDATIMVTSAKKPATWVAPENVIIVEPESPSEELQKLIIAVAAGLQKKGSSVTVSKLQTVEAADLSKTSCFFAVDCDTDTPLLSIIDENDWKTLQHLIMTANNTTWLTRGAVIDSENPAANLMTGLARCIRAENPSVSLTTIDLDFNKAIGAQETIDTVLQIYLSTVNVGSVQFPDNEYAIRDNKILVQRILLEKGMNDMISALHVQPKPELSTFKQAGRALELKAETPGRLDTLRFGDDASYDTPLAPETVEVETKAVGLNFKDVMIAMGQLEQLPLGLDYSGVVSRVGSSVTKFKKGDKVVSWTADGCFRTFARNPESMIVPLPAGMDFTDAASLPLIFCTAYYSLFDAAHLKKGESVLIHAAAGGVGQAAIMLAQHIGAEIFATVGSQAKKDLIMQKFGIPEDHIFNSRDDSFVNGVMRTTNNKGVNVVVNSLGGELLQKTWHCMAYFGRFVELGQKDITNNMGLDMAPFIKSISFHAVNMIALLKHDVPTSSRVWQDVMDLFNAKKIGSVAPVKSMPISELETAFRTMQMGKHIGKIVLECNPEDKVMVTPAKNKTIKFESNATYLLSGGLGGLGRSIAEWMVKNGAKNLVFLARSGSKKQEAKDTLDVLTKQGANVKAYACDVSKSEDVARAVKECAAEFPPIKGCIQGAAVLRDAIYENMTYEQWQGAVYCKVQGSWNLHEHLPKDMDFYVMLSSCAGVAGSRGQGNYCAGNTYMDALACHRQKNGMAGSSLDLGVILDVGLVAESESKEVRENTKKWGYAGIREKDLHALVQSAITMESMPGKKAPTQMITGLGTGGMAALAGQTLPWWFDDAKFKHVRDVDTHQVAAETSEDSDALQSLLQAATSMDTAAEAVSVALVKKLAKSLMVDVEDIESSRPISRYGVDSLLAVEIRSWIFTEIQADVSVFQLLSNVPISQLVRTIVSKSKCVSPAVAAEL